MEKFDKLSIFINNLSIKMKNNPIRTEKFKEEKIMMIDII